MALDAHTRDFWIRTLEPVGAGIARLGVTANGITTLGVLLTSVAAWLVISERLLVAGFVLMAGSLSDTLDGPVARARGAAGVSGGFFDSVADRVSDAVILSAIAWFVRGDPLLFAFAVTALATAQLTSYVRAKAESLGETCHVGIMERAERAIVLLAGLLLHVWLFEIALAVLAIGGVVTVIHRAAHVFPKLRRAEEHG